MTLNVRAVDRTDRGHKIKFECPPEFSADPKKGLVCGGIGKSGYHPHTARLFTTRGRSLLLANGWRVTGVHISGGDTQLRHSRDALVRYEFEITDPAAPYERVLQTISLTKRDGDCTKALAEAFNW